MGIQGLFKFLKRHEQTIHIPTYVKNKRIGVDVFWFLHQSKGDMFYFQNLIYQIIKYSDKVYCVFDGKPTPERKELLKKNAEKRLELEKSIYEIETFLHSPFRRISTQDRNYISGHLQQLKRQIWTPSRDYITRVKEWLTSKDVILYDADGDADDYLAELQIGGEIDVVITNDSDLLVLGASSVIRMKSPFIGALYDVNNICKNLGFSESMWDNFLCMCETMEKKDIYLAFTLISIYKDIEYSLQKYYTMHDNTSYEICHTGSDSDE